MAKIEKGTVFNGRYTILERIGAGGMATVYKALPEGASRPVAIKVLSQVFLARNPREAERNLRRFKREAEILRLLQGAPNVVGFEDHGCSDSGDWFIAMELLEGEQLRYYIGRGKSVMGAPTFLHLGVGLIEGLRQVHEKNVIHRDLAPDNVVIVKDAQGILVPKFLDFGIGKSVTGELDQVTQMVTIMGKPQYFSPEQARGQDQTTASDVYSLGVVLYEMLTGHVPLEIHGVPDFRKIQRDPPLPISNYREAHRVPTELQDVIMSCLSKDPVERPALEDLLGPMQESRERFNQGEIFESTEVAANTPDETISLEVSEVELRSGDSIDRYEIRSVLGKGGMGAVYLAWDPVLQREVAIKVATRVEEARAKKAILREARASSAIRSENIVTIYDAGSEGGTPFIAMEYVDGITLSDRIEDVGPLPGPEIGRVARAVAMGLAEAHDRENPVIHRDLKPGNILLGENTVKITDFGIAKVTSNMTRAGGETGAHGAAVGTAAIMSPEQADGKPVDHRSDIYSFGCVLYMMATGRGPFQGNAIAMLYQHCTAEPKPPSKTNSRLDTPELDAIILKCLQKKPEDRYQHAAEILEDLDALFRTDETIQLAWYKSPRSIGLVAVLMVIVAIVAFALKKGPRQVEHYDYVLRSIGDLEVNPAQTSYYAKKDSLGIAADEAADGATLEVIFSHEGSDEQVTRFVVADADGQIDAPVSLPLEEFGITGPYAVFQAAFRIQGDEDDPSPPVSIVYDGARPSLEYRDREGPWKAVGPSIETLRLQDLEFRFSDAGSGLSGEDPQAPVVLALGDGGAVSVPGTSIERVGETTEFRFRCHDNSGQELDRTIAIRTVPLFAKPSKLVSRVRENECELAVRLSAEDVDLKVPVRELFATVGGDRVPLSPEEGDLYKALVPLPDAPPGTVVNLPVGVVLEGGTVSWRDGRAPTIIHDRQDPVITLTWREGEAPISSADPDTQDIVSRASGDFASFLRIHVADGDDRGLEDDVEIAFEVAGTRTSAVRFRRSQLENAFPAELPDAREWKLIVKAGDLAGNQATLEVKVKLTTAQFSLLTSGSTHARAGRLYARSPDALQVALSASGLTPGRALFAEVHSDAGELVVARVAMRKDGRRWSLPGLPALSGGDCSVKIFDSETASAVAITTIPVQFDDQAPEISASLEGLATPFWPADLKLSLGHRPAIKIKVRDNLLLDLNPEDVICDPPMPGLKIVRTADGRSASIDIPRASADSAGTFTIEVRSRDAAANESPPFKRSFRVVPPRMAVLTVMGRELKDQAGPWFIRQPPLAIQIGNRNEVGNYAVRAMIAERGGQQTEGVRSTCSLGDTARLEVSVTGARGTVVLQFAELVAAEKPVTDWAPFATLQYIIDAAPPNIEVYRADNLVSSAELAASGVRTTRLSEVTIVVRDDQGGLGRDPLRVAGKPASSVGLKLENGSRPDRAVYRFEDRLDWSAMNLSLEAMDAAENPGQLPPFEITRIRDMPTFTGLLVNGSAVAAGGERTRLASRTFTVRAQDAANILKARVRITNERGGGETEVEMAHDATTHLFTADVNLPQDGEFTLDMECRKGMRPDWEPFSRTRVAVDTQAPVVQILAAGRPVAGELSARTAAGLTIRIEDGSPIENPVARLEGPQAQALSIRRNPAGLWTVRLTRLKPGSHRLVVTARDVFGNASLPASVGIRVDRPAFSKTAVEARTKLRAMPVKRPGGRPLYLSETEVTLAQYKLFVDAWKKDRAAFVRDVASRVKGYISRSAQRSLAEPGSAIQTALEQSRRSERNDWDMPVRFVKKEVAQLYCAWAGGRLPTASEWRGAAGRFRKASVKWPMYVDSSGTPRSNERSFKRHQGKWCNFKGTMGSHPMKTSTLRMPGLFGLRGMAGNVCEWVLDDGKTRVRGVLGGSFLTAPTDKSGASLDIRVRAPSSDGTRRTVGIRVCWDPEGS